VKKLRVLDLFSGIGGFSLGLERTGGFETVAFCEIEDFPRRVLAKHWPDIPCYHDVRELTDARLAADGIAGIDVITGGFPCQDISVAGHRKGLSPGTRSGLWSEIIRLAGDLRPNFIVIENVADLLVGPAKKRGAWFSRVLIDLVGCGYDAEWENIPAAAMGRIHYRERVWIVAYPDTFGLQRLRPVGEFYKATSPRLSEQRLQIHQKNYHGLCGSVWSADAGRIWGVHNGLSDRVERIKAIGNSIDPVIAELIGYAIIDAVKAEQAAA